MKKEMQTVTIFTTESRGSGFYASQRITRSPIPPANLRVENFDITKPMADVNSRRSKSQKMTKQSFSRSFMGIITTASSNDIPQFNAKGINGERLSEEMLPKAFKYEFKTGGAGNQDLIEVEWISRSWGNREDIDTVVREIGRCFKYIGYRDMVKLDIKSANYKKATSQHRTIMFPITRRM